VAERPYNNQYMPDLHTIDHDNCGKAKGQILLLVPALFAKY